MIDWPVIAEESAFQLVHTIDLGQTLDTRRCARCWESNNALDAGWAIGHRPSDRSVYAFMSAEGLLHAGVTVALERWAPRWTVHAWESVTIAIDGATVASNARLGLRWEGRL